MDKIDKAWAAGFFDGEGCIIIAKRPKDNFALQLTTVQIEVAPLYKLQRLWGGSVYPSKGKKLPCWTINGREAARFLQNIFPYLLVKAEQAKVGLEFAETIDISRRPLPNAVKEKRQTLADKLLLLRHKV